MSPFRTPRNSCETPLMAMTVKQVADDFGVSADTVRRWADQGLLPGYRLPSGHRRFTEQHVAAFRRSWFGDWAPAGITGGVPNG